MACEGFLEFYDETPLVKDNVFKSMPQDRTRPPAFSDVRHLLPQPMWAGHDAAIQCYFKAWEVAFDNLERPHRGNGFVSPYLATAFNQNLFMWDSVFALQMAKYGTASGVNFQKTLDNLYCKQHPDGHISKEIREWSGKDQWHRDNAASTGPNVLGFSEWEYYLVSGDKDRLSKVFPVLLAYHRWMRLNRSWPDGSYHSCGLACGMDNQPRVPGHNAWLSHGWMAWIDATCQALLSAKILSSMAFELGHAERKPASAASTDSAEQRDGLSLQRPETLQAVATSKYAADVATAIAECSSLAAYINDKMWDERRKFYVDRRLRTDAAGAPHSPVTTIGGFWALLAGAVPQERVKPLIAHLDDPRTFNRAVRCPSLPATDPHYSPTGGYWLGGVWPPTSLMVLRGLTSLGSLEGDDIAADIGKNYVEAVAAVYKRTGTLWENLSPESGALTDEHRNALRNATSATTRAFAESAAGRTALSSSAKGPVPGSPAKPDFVGWGGVPAITVLFEYVFGLRPSSVTVQVPPASAAGAAAGAGGAPTVKRALTLDVRLLDAYGVRRYPFYGGLLDVEVASRGAFDEPPKVKVTAKGFPAPGHGQAQVVVKWGRRSVGPGGWLPDRLDYKNLAQTFEITLASGEEGAANEFICSAIAPVSATGGSGGAGASSTST